MPSRRLIAHAAAVAVTIVPAPRLAAQHRPTTRPAISAEDLRARLFLIAHDSMMGREPGAEGDYKAAEYIASEFRRFGLEPAGDSGGYFQTVPFFRLGADPRSRLEAGGTTIALGPDALMVGVPIAPVSLNGVPSVYGGPATDPTRWIAPEAAEGKVVVLDLPPGPDGTRSFRGMTRLVRDARFARVAAVAVIALDIVPPEMRAAVEGGRLVTDTTRRATPPPFLVVTPAAGRAMLGADVASLSPGAIGRPVSGMLASRAAPVPFPARNVVAVLRGSDPALRNQYVALTAHNDHVGFDRSPVDHDSLRAFNRVVRPMGADSPLRPATPEEAARIAALRDSLRAAHPPRRDSIRNGADDDGSGTVSILEIAEAMARAPARPRRSVLFVSHTGEEAGLIGSAWFTDHPTVPIDSIIGEIDQDMIGRGTAQDLPEAGPAYLEVIGARRISKEFGDILEAANAAQPRPFTFNYAYDAPGHPLQYYCRADHYNYARYGIPSVALSRGEHLDYHQVTDEPQYIAYDDMARVSRLVHDAAMRLANLDHRPAVDGPKGDPHAACRQ